MADAVSITDSSSVDDVLAWIESIDAPSATQASKFKRVIKSKNIDGSKFMECTPNAFCELLGCKTSANKAVIKKEFLLQKEKALEIPAYDAEEELQNERDYRRSTSRPQSTVSSPELLDSPLSTSSVDFSPHSSRINSPASPDDNVEMIEEYDAEEELRIERSRRSIRNEVHLQRNQSATMILSDATAKLDSSGTGALIGSPVSWKHEVQAKQLRDKLRDALETEVVLTSMLEGLTAQTEKKDKIGSKQRKSSRAKISKTEIKKKVARLTLDIEKAKDSAASFKNEIAELHSDWRFGSTLIDFAKATGVAVPPVVPSCVEVIAKHGLEEEGLFRVPGENAGVARLRAGFEIGGDPLSSAAASIPDIATIASTLKLFLARLSDPVLTKEHYSSFVNTASIKDEGERKAQLNKLIFKELPLVNARLLSILMPFLQKVAAHSEKNKMPIRNLSVVFGPTLLRTDSDDMTVLMRDAAAVNMVLEFMIQHWQAIVDYGGPTNLIESSKDGDDCQNTNVESDELIDVVEQSIDAGNESSADNQSMTNVGKEIQDLQPTVENSGEINDDEIPFKNKDSENKVTESLETDETLGSRNDFEGGKPNYRHRPSVVLNDRGGGDDYDDYDV